MLVVDTSAVLAVILNEPEKRRLVEITDGEDFVAPASLPWEIGNAFSAGMKRKRFTLEEVQAGLKLYAKIPIRLRDVRLEEALEIASTARIYAYDAYMLACARQSRCPLLTLDGGLIVAAKLIGVETVEVSL